METLSWPRIETRLHTSTPWTLSMGGVRGIRIGFDPQQARLYIRMPADNDRGVPSGAYSKLELALRRDETGEVLEVSTASSDHFREFHRFASLLTEEYEREGQTAAEAFRSAIRGWEDFASRKPILTPDQQVGLFGELLLLKGLMRDRGACGVDAWIGREATGTARHDFRIGGVDLEVKTTRSAARRHFIHGAQQLVPAVGHELYILSLRLEAAGANAGQSLPDQVRQVRELAGAYGIHRERLDRKIASAQYRDEDEPFYDERLIVPDEPRLILVDDKCPRITPVFLNKEMAPDVATRIEQVSYQVNFEGLGMPAGSTGYEAVLANITLEIE